MLVLNAGLVILGVMKDWILLLVLNTGSVDIDFVNYECRFIDSGVMKDWTLLLVLNAGLVILCVMKLLLKEWTLLVILLVLNAGSVVLVSWKIGH